MDILDAAEGFTGGEKMEDKLQNGLMGEMLLSLILIKENIFHHFSEDRHSFYDVVLWDKNRKKRIDFKTSSSRSESYTINFFPR